MYRSCKDAPTSFQNISMEVLSLQAVLKETEETLFKGPLPDSRRERLKIILDGCKRVLEGLRRLIDSYERLSTERKLHMERLKWGLEDIAELRTRLISNMGLLNTFIRF